MVWTRRLTLVGSNPNLVRGVLAPRRAGGGGAHVGGRGLSGGGSITVTKAAARKSPTERPLCRRGPRRGRVARGYT